MKRALPIVLGSWVVALIPAWLIVKSAGGFDPSHWLEDVIIWVASATSVIVLSMLFALLVRRPVRDRAASRPEWTRSQRVFASIMAVALIALFACMCAAPRHEPAVWARISLFASILINVAITWLFTMIPRSHGRQPELRSEVRYP